MNKEKVDALLKEFLAEKESVTGLRGKGTEKRIAELNQLEAIILDLRRLKDIYLSVNRKEPFDPRLLDLYVKHRNDVLSLEREALEDPSSDTSRAAPPAPGKTGPRTAPSDWTAGLSPQIGTAAMNHRRQMNENIRVALGQAREKTINAGKTLEKNLRLLHREEKCIARIFLWNHGKVENTVRKVNNGPLTPPEIQWVCYMLLHDLDKSLKEPTQPAKARMEALLKGMDLKDEDQSAADIVAQLERLRKNFIVIRFAVRKEGLIKGPDPQRPLATIDAAIRQDYVRVVERALVTQSEQKKGVIHYSTFGLETQPIIDFMPFNESKPYDPKAKADRYTIYAPSAVSSTIGKEAPGTSFDKDRAKKEYWIKRFESGAWQPDEFGFPSIGIEPKEHFQLSDTWGNLIGGLKRSHILYDHERGQTDCLEEWKRIADYHGINDSPEANKDELLGKQKLLVKFLTEGIVEARRLIFELQDSKLKKENPYRFVQAVKQMGGDEASKLERLKRAMGLAAPTAEQTIAKGIELWERRRQEVSTLYETIFKALESEDDTYKFAIINTAGRILCNGWFDIRQREELLAALNESLQIPETRSKPGKVDRHDILVNHTLHGEEGERIWNRWVDFQGRWIHWVKEDWDKPGPRDEEYFPSPEELEEMPPLSAEAVQLLKLVKWAEARVTKFEEYVNVERKLKLADLHRVRLLIKLICEREMLELGHLVALAEGDQSVRNEYPWREYAEQMERLIEEENGIICYLESIEGCYEVIRKLVQTIFQSYNKDNYPNVGETKFALNIGLGVGPKGKLGDLCKLEVTAGLALQIAGTLNQQDDRLVRFNGSFALKIKGKVAFKVGAPKTWKTVGVSDGTKDAIAEGMQTRAGGILSPMGEAVGEAEKTYVESDWLSAKANLAISKELLSAVRGYAYVDEVHLAASWAHHLCRLWLFLNPTKSSGGVDLRELTEEQEELLEIIVGESKDAAHYKEILAYIRQPVSVSQTLYQGLTKLLKPSSYDVQAGAAATFLIGRAAYATGMVYQKSTTTSKWKQVFKNAAKKSGDHTKEVPPTEEVWSFKSDGKPAGVLKEVWSTVLPPRKSSLFSLGVNAAWKEPGEASPQIINLLPGMKLDTAEAMFGVSGTVPWGPASSASCTFMKYDTMMDNDGIQLNVQFSLTTEVEADTPVISFSYGKSSVRKKFDPVLIRRLFRKLRPFADEIRKKLPDKLDGEEAEIAQLAVDKLLKGLTKGKWNSGVEEVIYSSDKSASYYDAFTGLAQYGDFEVNFQLVGSKDSRFEWGFQYGRLSRSKSWSVGVDLPVTIIDASVELERESAISIFELLGSNTISYAQTVYSGVAKRPEKLATEMWKAYKAQHRSDLLEICYQVGRSGSGDSAAKGSTPPSMPHLEVKGDTSVDVKIPLEDKGDGVGKKATLEKAAQALIDACQMPEGAEKKLLEHVEEVQKEKKPLSRAQTQTASGPASSASKGVPRSATEGASGTWMAPNVGTLVVSHNQPGKLQARVAGRAVAVSLFDETYVEKSASWPDAKDALPGKIELTSDCLFVPKGQKLSILYVLEHRAAIDRAKLEIFSYKGSKLMEIPLIEKRGGAPTKGAGAIWKDEPPDASPKSQNNGAQGSAAADPAKPAPAQPPAKAADPAADPSKAPAKDAPPASPPSAPAGSNTTVQTSNATAQTPGAIASVESGPPAKPAEKPVVPAPGQLQPSERDPARPRPVAAWGETPPSGQPATGLAPKAPTTGSSQQPGQTPAAPVRKPDATALVQDISAGDAGTHGDAPVQPGGVLPGQVIQDQALPPARPSQTPQAGGQTEGGLKGGSSATVPSRAASPRSQPRKADKRKAPETVDVSFIHTIELIAKEAVARSTREIWKAPFDLEAAKDLTPEMAPFRLQLTVEVDAADGKPPLESKAWTYFHILDEEKVLTALDAYLKAKAVFQPYLQEATWHPSNQKWKQTNIPQDDMWVLEQGHIDVPGAGASEPNFPDSGQQKPDPAKLPDDAIKTGLANLGATCYLNSTLKFLAEAVELDAISKQPLEVTDEECRRIAQEAVYKRFEAEYRQEYFAELKLRPPQIEAEYPAFWIGIGWSNTTKLHNDFYPKNPHTEYRTAHDRILGQVSKACELKKDVNPSIAGIPDALLQDILRSARNEEAQKRAIFELKPETILDLSHSFAIVIPDAEKLKIFDRLKAKDSKYQKQFDVEFLEAKQNLSRAITPRRALQQQLPSFLGTIRTAENSDQIYQAQLDKLYGCLWEAGWTRPKSAEQDASELLTKIFDTLDPRGNTLTFELGSKYTAVAGWPYMGPYNKPGVASARKDSYVTTKREQPLLTFDVKDGHKDLQATVDDYFAPTLMYSQTNLENGYFMDVLVRQPYVVQAPEVFIYHSKCFAVEFPSGKKVKKNLGLKIADVKLTVGEPKAGESRKVETYEPWAAVRHYGKDIESGHYTMYERTKDGRWVWHNDKNPPVIVDVSQVHESEANNNYLILFRRKKDGTPAAVVASPAPAKPADTPAQKPESGAPADPQAVPKDAIQLGLANIHSTCWMNAMIQLLAVCPELDGIHVSKPGLKLHEIIDRVRRNILEKEFQNLYMEQLGGLKPSEVDEPSRAAVQTLLVRNSKDYRVRYDAVIQKAQGDAADEAAPRRDFQESLRRIVEALRAADKNVKDGPLMAELTDCWTKLRKTGWLKRVDPGAESNPGRFEDAMLFLGYVLEILDNPWKPLKLRQRYKPIAETGEPPVITEPIEMLPWLSCLIGDQVKTIQEVVDQFFQETKVPDFLRFRNRGVIAQSFVSEEPEAVLIWLKRFHENGQKVLTRLTLDKQLKLPIRTADPSFTERTIDMEPWAVVRHRGRTLAGGGNHFVLCERTKDGSWVLHDDSHVEGIATSEVDDSDSMHSYLVLYRRKGAKGWKETAKAIRLPAGPPQLSARADASSQPAEAPAKPPTAAKPSASVGTAPSGRPPVKPTDASARPQPTAPIDASAGRQPPTTADVGTQTDPAAAPKPPPIRRIKPPATGPTPTDRPGASNPPQRPAGTEPPQKPPWGGGPGTRTPPKL